MNKNAIYHQILALQSYLCIGLDTDPALLPRHLNSASDPVLAFNQAIIETTHPYCVSYKLNTAFYEAQGLIGWERMLKTIEMIPKDKLIIADAKRGDIGNTGKKYAQAFFETYGFDAITVAPYMGEDSIKPFLEYNNKWAIVLALTSNAGSQDFQMQRLKNDKLVYESVIEKAIQWGTDEQLMFVVGATQTALLPRIRKLIPSHFLLVPGVGTQGGDIEEVTRYGINEQVGLLINASRSILYASSEDDFAQAAQKKAQAMQKTMQECLDKYLTK